MKSWIIILYSPSPHLSRSQGFPSLPPFRLKTCSLFHRSTCGRCSTHLTTFLALTCIESWGDVFGELKDFFWVVRASLKAITVYLKLTPLYTIITQLYLTFYHTVIQYHNIPLQPFPECISPNSFVLFVSSVTSVFLLPDLLLTGLRIYLWGTSLMEFYWKSWLFIPLLLISPYRGAENQENRMK